jgi:hypothetical protein
MENARLLRLSAFGGLPASLVIAVYFHVRLIPLDFGSLAAGHFPSASHKPVFRHSPLYSIVRKLAPLLL